MKILKKLPLALLIAALGIFGYGCNEKGCCGADASKCCGSASADHTHDETATQ